MILWFPTFFSQRNHVFLEGFHAFGAAPFTSGAGSDKPWRWNSDPRWPLIQYGMGWLSSFVGPPNFCLSWLSHDPNFPWPLDHPFLPEKQLDCCWFNAPVSTTIRNLNPSRSTFFSHDHLDHFFIFKKSKTHPVFEGWWDHPFRRSFLFLLGAFMLLGWLNHQYFLMWVFQNWTNQIHWFAYFTWPILDDVGVPHDEKRLRFQAFSYMFYIDFYRFF